MNKRWAVVGLITLLVLFVLAFTLIRSCHRVDRPPREPDTPREFESRVELEAPRRAEPALAIRPLDRA